MVLIIFQVIDAFLLLGSYLSSPKVHIGSHSNPQQLSGDETLTRSRNGTFKFECQCGGGVCWWWIPSLFTREFGRRLLLDGRLGAPRCDQRAILPSSITATRNLRAQRIPTHYQTSSNPPPPTHPINQRSFCVATLTHMNKNCV